MSDSDAAGGAAPRRRPSPRPVATPAESGSHTAAGDGPDAFEGPSWDQDVPSRPEGAQRRRRISRRRLRRRRRLGLVLIGFGALIVLGGLWLVVTGLLARDQLDAVRGEITTLHQQIAAGDLAGARTSAHQIASHAHRAELLTTGPAWAIAASLPGGGEPFAVVRDITRQTDVLGSSVLPGVIEATRQLDPATLRAPNGTIDLARISAAAPTLNLASSQMSRATASIARQPAATWLGFVDSARAQFLTRLQTLGKTLRSADLAARIAPAMLGQHGTRRYFVAFQNDAEARGTGGLPGAFAIVRVTNGKIAFERFEPDGALFGVSASVRFGADYDAIWHVGHPYTQYVDSNTSPNFPYAARIWISMWKNKTGESLDGALAVDPQALSYLLAVTGPAALPDGTQVSAANVVALTQQQLYAKFASRTARGNAQRKQYLLDVARAVSEKVLHTTAGATALIKAAGQAGVERRLQIYSTDPAIEKSLQSTSLSGVVPETRQPFAALIVNNAAGNKLDYYLERSLSWRRTGCGTTRQVVVTARLTNAAPAGLPPYVEERNDHPSFPVRPGDNREFVLYYATHGAIISSVELDGRRQQFFANFERGHPVFGLDVEIPRGATRTITYRLTEPAGTNRPIILRQPLVNPMKVRVENQSCS